MNSTHELAMNKNTLIRFLKGEITEEKEPAFFHDDIFFLLVRDLEAQDYKWLLEKVKSPLYKKELRGIVVLNMTNENQKDLINLFF